MRGVTLLVLAALLGAVSYYGISRFLRRDGEVTGPAAGGGIASGGAAAPVSVATTGGAPAASLPAASLPAGGSPSGQAPRTALAAKPRFFQGDSEQGGAQASQAPQISQALDTSQVAQISPASPNSPISSASPISSSAQAEAASAGAPVSAGSPASAGAPAGTARAVASGIEQDRRVAQAALAAGEKDRGLSLIRQIYAVSKDRVEVDLTPEVATLAESEKDPARRLEYLQYLAKRDRTGRIFDEKLSQCVKKLAVADESAEAAEEAWGALTVAYVVAQDRSQKKKVVDLLDPFIQEMVFSGKYTPLLKSYTVQAGDSLTSIAAKNQTTPDALRRLNGLKNDNIQPRQRIRILPGKARIYVDKSDFILWATIDGRIFLEFPVGLGKDKSTPATTFVIGSREKDPTWWRPGQPSLPPGHPENILGTRWLGFRETPEYAGFGIHGTSRREDLQRESSSGCVRLYKDDIELLYDFVNVGTEVVVER